MIYRSNPRLITIEGECGFLGGDPYEIAEVLGIDIADARMISSKRLTPRDMAYLGKRYPEYMGVIPLIVAGAGAVATGARALKSTIEAVKSVKPKKKEPQITTGVSAQTAVLRKLAQLQKGIKSKQEVAPGIQKAGMMQIAVPLALGLGALLLFGRR